MYYVQQIYSIEKKLNIFRLKMPLIIVSGPPASGKTRATQLLEASLALKGRETVVVTEGIQIDSYLVVRLERWIRSIHVPSHCHANVRPPILNSPIWTKYFANLSHLRIISLKTFRTFNTSFGGSWRRAWPFPAKRRFSHDLFINLIIKIYLLNTIYQFANNIFKFCCFHG